MPVSEFRLGFKVGERIEFGFRSGVRSGLVGMVRVRGKALGNILCL